MGISLRKSLKAEVGLMLNICISGAAGRMGAALIEASREKDWIRISGLLEKEGSPEIGRIVSGVEIVSDVKKAVDGCDCFIEFTTPFRHAKSHLRNRCSRCCRHDGLYV